MKHLLHLLMMCVAFALMDTCTMAAKYYDDKITMCASLTQYNPELVVTIMVKNEEAVIVPTLEPFFKAGITAFLVLDTGSDDRTIENVQQFFGEHPDITGYIVSEPFIDFAASRNRALELTREFFPTAGYIIMPDAEWYIQDAETLVTFCKEELARGTMEPSYLIRLIYGNIDFYQARMIRCQSNGRFVGVVHETLDHITQHKAPNSVYFVVAPTPRGAEKTRNRWKRDLELLLKEYTRNPYDVRTVFYLAQTYDCLGDWANAITYYRLRTQMQGWDEETFMAQYRLAQALDAHTTDWDTTLRHYLKAYTMRPHRIEPLIKIAQHYWDTGEYALCFLFSKFASEVPYPHQDMLFVDKDMCEWMAHDYLGRAAWHVGHFDVGKKAVEHALSIRPDIPHLAYNLNCYA